MKKIRPNEATFVFILEIRRRNTQFLKDGKGLGSLNKFKSIYFRKIFEF